MAEKTPPPLLRDVLGENKDYINVCLNLDIAVICFNSETRNKKHMPFKILYGNNPKFWKIEDGSWDFYITNGDYIKIKEAAVLPQRVLPVNDTAADDEPVKEVSAETVKAEPAKIELAKTEPLIVAETVKRNESDPEKAFEEEYKSLAAMPTPMRIQKINDDKTQLDLLIIQKPRQKERVTEALINTTRDAVLHNHAALMNVINLSGDEAKEQTQNLVDSTKELVKSSVQLITTDIFNDELMNTLVSKSNGTIIQHMIRVYLNGLAFMAYYNKLVSTSSAIVKMRISFDEKYKEFYAHLLPHVHPDQLNLEKVYLGGMGAISENEFYNWAAGFLVHDIGKAFAVEYHEGEAAYDREIVTEHVKAGYTSIMNKTNYPKDVALITGYHHEYYGDPAGYGYFRSYLEYFQKKNPFSRRNACIAFNVESIINCEALAFFPAKVLEIIDVYDSVTDPNRKYRKAMKPEEALNMMCEEFIIKHQKLDIILFDIFSDFVRESMLQA